MNPDLQKERKNVNFNQEKLTNILDGSAELTARRRRVVRLAEEDPDYKSPEYFFLTRDEQYTEGVRRNVLMTRKVKQLGITDPREFAWYRRSAFPQEANPHGLQSSMFLPTITGQGTEEQAKYWMDKVEREGIIGTYAQTEMGHGTFLRGLETTAIYDEAKEEFVLNSPTLTSTKWWPGGLGISCNYAVVLATLYIKGKKHGMQPFMVQLRDINNHKPLPGRELGDIGPKFAYNMIDNGYLRLDHVRIPRNHMLMKNSQVLPDGTFVKSKHEKLGYGTMVLVRAGIVVGMSVNLAQATTIAIRYSCVRHQSEMNPGHPEPQILDYQSQQLKLFPALAMTFAFWFAGMEMMDIYNKTNASIMRGNVQALPELHALSAGLKAYTTDRACDQIEVCRRSCGGHGYSHAAGIAKIYGHAVPACTLEGENTVMYLQCARYLMKCYGQAQAGQMLADSVAYIGGNQGPQTNQQSELQTLLSAFQNRARSLIRRASENISRLRLAGHPGHVTWNQSHLYLLRAAQAHLDAYVMAAFVRKLVSLRGEAAIQSLLTTLCKLWAYTVISAHSGEFMQSDCLRQDDVTSIDASIPGLLAEIRPQAVPLVDSFDFTDHQLSSVLGRYDGNVYENLLKWAQESPLNKKEVHDSFEKYVKPVRLASKI